MKGCFSHCHINTHNKPALLPSRYTAQRLFVKRLYPHQPSTFYCYPVAPRFFAFSLLAFEDLFFTLPITVLLLGWRAAGIGFSVPAALECMGWEDTSITPATLTHDTIVCYTGALIITSATLTHDTIVVRHRCAHFCDQAWSPSWWAFLEGGGLVRFLAGNTNMQSPKL